MIKTTSIAAKNLSKPAPNFEKRPQKNVLVPQKNTPTNVSLGSYQKFSATTGIYNQYTQYYYAWQMGPQLAALAAFLVWIDEGTFDNYANNMIVVAHQALAMHNQVFTGNGSNLCNVGTDLTLLTSDQLLSLSNETLSCFINNVWNILVDAEQDTASFATPAVIHFTGTLEGTTIIWYSTNSKQSVQLNAIFQDKEITTPENTIPVPTGISSFVLWQGSCFSDAITIIDGKTYNVDPSALQCIFTNFMM